MGDRKRLDRHTVFAALVVALIVALYWAMFYDMGFSSGRNQQRSHEQAEHYAADTSERLNKDCAALEGAALRECAYKFVKSEREELLTEDDLSTQRKAADWALWAVVIAGAQLLATIVGLNFIKSTLDATWEAVKDTGEATKEMVESNRIAREAGAGAEKALAYAQQSAEAASRQITTTQETAYRQLRAYISVEVLITEITPKTICGKLLIKNAGQTPAAIKLYLNQFVAGFPTLEMPKGAPNPDRFQFHAPYINAGHTEPVDWFYPLGADGTADIAKLEANYLKLALFVYGRVEFLDYLRHERLLFFAYRNHGLIKPGANCDTVALPFGNTYDDRGIIEKPDLWLASKSANGPSNERGGSRPTTR